jgi:hypothetical protein
LRLNRKIAVELVVLSAVEAGGIRGVAVKCLDITKNSDCEGSSLELQLTLKLESVGIKQD